MKITEEYNDTNEFDLIEITKADYLGNYKIKINFSDDTIRIINFKTFLNKTMHPSLKKYLNEEIFANFNLVDGNLNWNDYDMIFPLSDLYENKI